ncbi:hypothetical protein CVT24_008343 [Panaeolus cyanescens]|uniref:Dicer-like protein 1 n=1 Tax=Panaeolus cyanescens TaxID=181874 RepID=A0A409VCD0_9AGAR|nr:hypothetical protein CVT24_008343 [Panaeolus cyanescens]
MSWINTPEDSQALRGGITDPVTDSRGTYTKDELKPLQFQGGKRPRDEEHVSNLTSNVVERPAKFAKLDAKDSIRNHLPEIVGAGEREESFLQTSWLQIGDQVLDHAKRENTISILPSAKSSNILLKQVMTWSMQENHDNGKIAFIVVDDVALMHRYYSLLESHVMNRSIAKCEEDGLADTQWEECLRNRFLLNSLKKGMLNVGHVHLLVITNAQTIENQDCHHSMSIVQVMYDFYRRAQITTRPRILALAALPPDKRYHFDSKTLKLEQTLDAKVFGISSSKREEILALPDRPNEIVILYDLIQGVPETRLTKQIRQFDPTESIFAKYHRASRLAYEEVGPCASDLIWRRALSDLVQDDEPWFDMADDEEHDIPSVDTIKRRIHGLVKNGTYTMPNLDATSRGFNVSHKFSRLVQVLWTFRALGDGFRGIIFVQKRCIALVLTELLRTINDRLSFLRPQTVIGKKCATNEEYYVEFKFTSGVYNLLIATKSSEDLDLPKVSLVVRYDLFESQISHAYVRARTRGRESHLVHLIQRGNDAQRRILNRITNIDANMLRWTEILSESAESSVPPDTLRETINPYHSDSEDEEEGQNHTCVKDAITGGRIYIQDATHVVYRYAAYAASLRMDIPNNHKLFSFEDAESGFDDTHSYRCTINLPGTVINGISGEFCPIKALARRSACLRACELLHRSNLLNSKLVPLPSVLRNSHMYDPQIKMLPEAEGTLPGTRIYSRKQPDFWVHAPKGIPQTLYPLIMTVQGSEKCSIPYGPMLILTREPSPELPPFRIFVSGVSLQVHFRRVCSFEIDPERMNETHLYTIRIYRAVMNKALTCSLEDMHYFFLPLSTGWETSKASNLDALDVAGYIPWDDVRAAAHHWAVPITAEAMEQGLPDTVVQDRWIEFTRRYCVEAIRRDLTPLSKPVDSQRERNYENLFAFCKAKRKNLEGLKDYAQPIIQVNRFLPVANHLNPATKTNTETGRAPAKYLIPELCAKFTLPASILQTAMLLPSVMRRVDDLLLVKEMDARLFDHAINEDLLHNAICTPSAGLEYDYERLELLGDAFLKYLSSVYVFVTHASAMEGSLHVLRQKIISNKALLSYASRVGVPAYIQSKMFTLKSWHPPNFKVIPTPRRPPNGEQGGKVNVPLTGGRVDDPTAESLTETPPGNSLLDASQVSAETPNTTVVDGATPAGGDVEHDPFPVDTVPDDPMADDGSVQGPGQVAQSRQLADDAMFEDSTTVQANGAHNDRIRDDAMVQDEPGSAHQSIPDGVAKTEQPTKSKPSNEGKSKAKPKRKKGQDEQQATQVLGDKAIADVAEAIIGAAYISGGREAALKVTKALSVPIANVDRWSDFGRKVLTPPPDFITKLRPGSIAAIESIIGHKFIRPHLLAQAMTHSSIQGYEATSYERLEFLGDAILDFMVIRHIFDRDQQLAPGALTMLKACGAMVSNAALGAVCVWSGLDQHLLFESLQLEGSIQEYKVDLKSKQDEEYQLAKQEGRSPGQYWLGIEPPKALSDVMESIIGAVYISDNFSPTGAEAVFDNVLKPFYDQHIRLQTLSHHPTKILLEILQAQGCHQFEITKEKLDSKAHSDVIVHDVILASADDTTQVSAARMSSIFALDALEGDADFMKRVCDCRASSARGRKRNIEETLKETLSEGLPAISAHNVDEGSATKDEA